MKGEFLKDHKRKLVFVAVFIVFLGLIAVLVDYQKGSTKGSQTAAKVANSLPTVFSGNYQEDAEKWAKRIDEVGAEKAYEQFKEEYKAANFGVQHSMAHVFGTVLYDKEGLEGVKVCDDSFGYGCYHSYFAKAMSDKGVDIIYRLDQECLKKWGLRGLGCPHGIGHSLLIFLGDDKINEALEMCDKLSWKEPIGGCTSGVFMEYNLRTVHSISESASIRTLKPGEEHTPCTFVRDKFLQACYFESPNWWSQLFQKDYKRVGKLCSEVKDELVQEACYRGTGNAVAPDSNFAVAPTLKGCSQMPTAKGRLLCRQGASWSFSAQPNFEHLAIEICRDLDSEIEESCTKATDLFNDK